MHLAILAPGLLGASTAMAARKTDAAQTITLWSRKPSTRAALKKQPWCDHVASTPESAVANADLVILAAPVDIIIELLPKIAPFLKPTAIVTDVGSVKTPICKAAAKSIKTATFIGSHPMAGSEKTGWQNGTPTLFQNRTTFITPLPKTPKNKTLLLQKFWQTLGASTAIVTPAEHDQITAAISHLPQALATALAATLATTNPVWKKYAGNGLRDTTRIAASDPDMWLPIYRHNRPELLKALQQFHTQLSAFTRALKTRDEKSLRQLHQRAQHYRQSLDQ